jgi:hypothetical protein
VIIGALRTAIGLAAEAAEPAEPLRLEVEELEELEELEAVACCSTLANGDFAVFPCGADATRRTGSVERAKAS